MNVSRSNKYGIKIDLDMSHGSYLYDKNSRGYLLDFMGMFASLPLGYNHPVFKTKEFQDEILRISHTKVTNCFISCDESQTFDESFTSFAPDIFKHFYYCCTGSLAVESAMKAALEKNNGKDPRILTFEKSFHGINGWASFVTSRDYPVGPRLGDYPVNFALECPEDINSFKSLIESNNVAAVLIEPIRATHGDIHFAKGFIKTICDICDNQDILVIFDEVQTGMGATGTHWYYQQLGVQPDIVVFGKKAQLSGFMATDKVSPIFTQKEKKLEATWDATLIDMIRCKHIIKAYTDFNILENVHERSKQLMSSISNPKIKNLRGAGLLIGFDLDSEKDRNYFKDECYNKGLLINGGGSKSIRLRPNLEVTPEEINKAVSIINTI